MKVLHVRSSRGYYGAEALIEALCTAQAARGDDVVVAGLIDAREPHTELLHRLDLRGVSTAHLNSSGRFDPAVVGALVALIRKTGADVLHTHDYKTVIMGLPAAMMAGCALVSTFHGEVGDTAPVRAYETMARVALRLYDGVALVSQAQSSALDGGLRRAAPTFIPNAVDVDGLQAKVESLKADGRRESWRRALGASPDDVLVGTVGRLTRDKGQVAALPAMASLMAKAPGLRWVLAGGGEDGAELASEAERLGVADRVHVLGFVEDMPEFYAGVDVLLHPSYKEGLPMTVLEAMAAGLPVVASPVGALPEVLCEGAGILIHDRDAAIGSALAPLIEHREAREGLGDAGRERVRAGYSSERLARQYHEALYAPALRRRGRR